jgi:hypothetical protein
MQRVCNAFATRLQRVCSLATLMRHKVEGGPQIASAVQKCFYRPETVLICLETGFETKFITQNGLQKNKNTGG